MPGTMRKLTLDGVSFDCVSDADWTEVFAGFTNSILQTSKGGVVVQETRTREVSGVQISLQKGDRALLKSIIEVGKIIDMSYTNRDGDRYSGRGIVNTDGRTTMRNVATLTLLPIGDWTEELA
jgi:hypothetical protein